MRETWQEKDSVVIDNKWRKAVVFDNTVNYVMEKEAENPGSSFAAKELNTMYIEQLKVHGIEEKVNTTRFTERLLKSIPDLYSETVNGKTRLIFKSQVKELIGSAMQWIWWEFSQIFPI